MTPRALPIFLSALLGSLGCDHASKQLALSALPEAGRVYLAGGSLRLELASNPGAFLSLGADLPEGLRELIFLGLVPVAITALCAYFLRTAGGSVALLIGLGLVAGGGLANWLDRLFHDGAVTDFITLTIGPLRTGIFNVADVAVMAGVVLLLAATRRQAPPPREEPA